VRELRPTTETPEAPDVHDGRDDVGAHHRAVPPRDLTARTRTKHDEDVTEELVPAFAPELRHGRGHPGSVGDAPPLRRRLAEEDLAAERAGLVHDVDRGVDGDHAAEGDAGYLEEAREDVEGVVEDGVALEAVCGWAHELNGVVRCVERGDLDHEFEELCGE